MASQIVGRPRDDFGVLQLGLQIVGRPRDDFGVLQLAHALEQEPRVVAVAASARLRHPSGSKSSGRTGA